MNAGFLGFGKVETPLKTKWEGPGLVNSPAESELEETRGRILQVVQVKSTTTDSTSTQIPADITIPQNTEGKEYTALTSSITPKSDRSRLRFEVVLNFSASNAGVFAFALFKDSDADALAVAAGPIHAVLIPVQLTMDFWMDSPGCAPATFKIRFGPSGAAVTAYLNQISAGVVNYGGRWYSGLRITEYFP